MFKDSLFYTKVIQQSKTIPNYRNVITLNRQEKRAHFSSRIAPDTRIRVIAFLKRQESLLFFFSIFFGGKCPTEYTTKNNSKNELQAILSNKRKPTIVIITMNIKNQNQSTFFICSSFIKCIIPYNFSIILFNELAQFIIYGRISCCRNAPFKWNKNNIFLFILFYIIIAMKKLESNLTLEVCFKS